MATYLRLLFFVSALFSGGAVLAAAPEISVTEQAGIDYWAQPGRFHSPGFVPAWIKRLIKQEMQRQAHKYFLDPALEPFNPEHETHQASIQRLSSILRSADANLPGASEVLVLGAFREAVEHGFKRSWSTLIPNPAAHQHLRALIQKRLQKEP